MSDAPRIDQLQPPGPYSNEAAGILVSLFSEAESSLYSPGVYTGSRTTLEAEISLAAKGLLEKPVVLSVHGARPVTVEVGLG